MRLAIDTKDHASSIRIGFTDQQLTTHGGMIVWSHFIQQKRFRQQLREVLPPDPTSPNAYDPTDVVLGYTRQGLKPCHRPLIAGLAEAKLIANYWLRAGNTACINGAAEFLRQTVRQLPGIFASDWCAGAPASAMPACRTPVKPWA